MATFEGGAALPVTTGGAGITEARDAVPVYVVPGGPVLGQRARRVVVVTSGPVEGGAARPVYDAGAGALYSNEAALPVYVVQGPSLSGDPLAYSNKVNATAPANLIAHWAQAESSGTMIVDESGAARNGTYTGVTLGNAGIGDGRTSAGYDGATSKGNIYSASLAGAFNGAEGTFALWFNIAPAAWTDGVIRYMALLQADASNRVFIYKDSANNTWNIRRTAGGTNKQITISSAPVVMTHAAITWSESAGQMKAYVNGVQQGATQTAIGTFAGALSATGVTLGSNGTGPAAVTLGNLAHAALWNTPLSAAQIAALAVVP